MRYVRSIAFAGFVVVSACSRSPSGHESPAPAAPAPAPAAPAAKRVEPPRPSVEDTTFKLTLVGEPAYAAGKPGLAKLSLEALGGYHVNQEYPIRVDVKAPAGVTLGKAAFGRPDAAEFGEHSARFELPFSATPGAHDLTATVDFAVCTKETCVPDQRTVAFNLKVQ